MSDEFSDKKTAPAVQRNKAPILEVLKKHFPTNGHVLELASGSGEHCVHFARAFPSITFQPSDIDSEAIKSINAYIDEEGIEEEGADNISPPVYLDSSHMVWKGRPVDVILCLNMVHIAPWSATTGLFKGAVEALTKNGKIILYGPYFEEGVETVQSNLSFHKSLGQRNPQWGIRYLENVKKIASDCGFTMIDRVEMPANNLTIVFQRN